jgi:HD-GYP domain-containing protein (c-di-GMP phosphodiesterase class II)
MYLSPINGQSIALNQPLPFSLVDKHGILLAKKGFVFESEKLLNDLESRGGGFFIDFKEGGKALRHAHQSYVNRLQSVIRNQKPLGEIAKVGVQYAPPLAAGALEPQPVDWPYVLMKCNVLLHSASAEKFDAGLEEMVAFLTQQNQHNPDGMLFALFYLSSEYITLYSATHSLLCSVMCVLAAKDVLRWSDEEVALLFRATLTMNIGMTALQDRLAMQKTPLDEMQRAAVDGHTHLATDTLESLGVEDRLWLDTVRNHHAYIHAPLQARREAHRFAGLIQRADVFSARLAPRVSRAPSSAAQAMRAIYFDSDMNVDGAGAALIKAVGIYPPGSFVRLHSGEVAVVLQRGPNTAIPKVAVVLNRHALASVEPIVRDTSVPAYAIASHVLRGDVRVHLSLEKMLALTRARPA